jgi:hypothetical protein
MSRNQESNIYRQPAPDEPDGEVVPTPWVDKLTVDELNTQAVRSKKARGLGLPEDSGN